MPRKKKMGRPTENNEALKSHLVPLRIDDETLGLLDSYVKENQTNRSSFIRQLIRNYKKNPST